MLKVDGNIALQKIRSFLASKYFIVAVYLIATLFFTFRAEIYGLIAIIIIASAVLFLIDDLMPVFYCIMMGGVMVLRLYDSFNKLIPLIWVVVIPAIAITFHFIYYKPVKRKKRFTIPYLLISIALVLGGLFSIKPNEYFAGTALYYTIGCGFAMLLVYMLFSGYFNPKNKYDTKFAFSNLMFWVGLFGITILVLQYVLEVIPLMKNLGNFTPSQEYTDMLIGGKLQMGNNLSTVLLITMPFGYYLAKKSKVGILYFAIAVLHSFAMIFSMSRGGLIFGVVMLLTCLTSIIYLEKNNKKKLLSFFVTLIVIIFAIGFIVFKDLDMWSKLFNVAFLFYKMSTKTLLVFVGGTLLFSAIAIFLFFVFVAPKKVQRKIYCCLGIFTVVGIVGMFVFWDKVYSLLINFDWSRAEMANIAINNFPKYPIFGTGMGFTGMRHIYFPKKGMLDCYHSAPFQIIGSMGIVGIIAYSFMVIKRLKFLTENKSNFNTAIYLSIFGLYLMSLINPGIFMPFVYGFALVGLTIASEVANEPNCNIDIKIGNRVIDTISNNK